MIASHPVKQLSGETAVSVIASGEPRGGSAGRDFYCDFGKLGRTVGGDNYPSFGVDSVITVVIVHNMYPFILVLEQDQISCSCFCGGDATCTGSFFRAVSMWDLIFQRVWDSARIALNWV